MYIFHPYLSWLLPRIQFPAASKVEATTCAADIGGTFSSAAASAKLTASSLRRRELRNGEVKNHRKTIGK